MKKQIGKLKRARGFSISELLCVVLVLGLLTAAMAVGVSGAVKAYNNSVTLSEAKVLYSTIDAAVSDALRYETERPVVAVDQAGHVTVDGEKLLPDKTYTKYLTAAIGVTERSGSGGLETYYTVSLAIKNAAGDALVSGSFDVIPVNR